MQELFRKFAHTVSEATGSSWAFLIAFGTIIAWAVSGPVFHFSETWQLVINTGTTIVTFLMVFLVQNAQNRDSRATHLKLDEIIHSMKGARNKMIDAEDFSDAELDDLKQKLATASLKRAKKRKTAKSKKTKTT